MALGLGPNVQTIPMSFVVFSDEIVSHLQCSSSALCELCWSFEVGGVWDQHADLRCDAAHLLTVLLMEKKNAHLVSHPVRGLPCVANAVGCWQPASVWATSRSCCRRSGCDSWRRSLHVVVEDDRSGSGAAASALAPVGVTAGCVM